MLKSNILEQISQQITQVIQNNPFNNIEENVKTIILSIFKKLDLVTREEFELQQKILLATREKVEQLEEQLQYLQSKSQSKD